MTTAQSHLEGYGVTMQVARDFLMDNIDDVHTIYSVCQQFGVNNDMIAEILQSDFPGVNGTIVSSFFDNNGFSGASLGFSSSDIVADGIYTGTYDGAASGLFSFSVTDDQVTGTWTNPSWNESGYVSGYVDNETGDLNVTSSDSDGDISFIGILTTQSTSGTWSSAVGTGVFSGELA